MQLILLKVEHKEIDLTTTKGLQWLEKNIHTEQVEIFTSQKSYSKDKLLDIFQLIQQGAVITNGRLFESVSKIL